MTSYDWLHITILVVQWVFLIAQVSIERWRP